MQQRPPHLFGISARWDDLRFLFFRSQGDKGTACCPIFICVSRCCGRAAPARGTGDGSLSLPLFRVKNELFTHKQLFMMCIRTWGGGKTNRPTVDRWDDLVGWGHDTTRHFQHTEPLSCLQNLVVLFVIIAEAFAYCKKDAPGTYETEPPFFLVFLLNFCICIFSYTKKRDIITC